MRKSLGYLLLVVSCIAWAVLPVIPFLPLTTEARISWGTGTFVFAEVTWWLGIPLLGREFIELSKRWWLKAKEYLPMAKGEQ